MSIILNDVKKSIIHNVREIVLINLYKNRQNGMYRFSCEWASTTKRYFDYDKESDRDEDYTNVIVKREYEWKHKKDISWLDKKRTWA